MVIQEFVFEVRCGVNEFDHCIFFFARKALELQG